MKQPFPPALARIIRSLWVVGGIALAVLVLYAGFALWVGMTSGDAIAAAQRLLSEGQPAAARRSLGWLLWFQPNHADALMLLGNCLQAEQEFDAAAEAFSGVPIDSPRHEEASFSQAVAYLHQARIEAAEDAMVRHLRRYPTGGKHSSSQAVHEELRWLYFNLFRPRELEQFLTASLKRHPGDFSLLFHLLYSEFRPPIAQEALGYLKPINQRQPGQPSVLLALGYCSWKLGDAKTAWQQIEAALELRPEHLETRLVAAEVLLEQDQLDAAEALLSRPEDASSSLGEQFQQDDRWWWLRSKLAQLRGDDALALGYLEEATALRPSELRYVHRRGVLLQAMGKTEEAAQAFAGAKQLEQCESRLATIVLSNELERPTVDLCLDVADLCEKRGRKLQAAGWRHVAQQLPR
ncbi:MAG: hypothetical protein A2V98_16630 [Planctomycetes bacterium RBG_16_64_12]|nr:MAG: hypothetical protein A2V98_16630 [Planctomycetes bacterium RBG_16_64_12]